MKNPLANQLLVMTVLTAALFTLAAWFVPVIELKRWMDSARIGVYVVLFCVVAKTAWDIYWKNAKTGGERAAVALATLTGTILLHSLWTPFKREFGAYFPDWFINGQVGSLIVLLYIISGLGFLMPIGNTIGVTPPRNYGFLLAAFTIGGVVVGLMIGLGIKPTID